MPTGRREKSEEDKDISVVGSCDEAFALVRTVMEENVAQFGDRGATVCVRMGGRVVVDLRVGERKEGQPWDEDTLVNVYSCTKAMTSLAVLVLIDRGHLDWNMRVGALWPAFACEGKESLTVEHLLTHQSGLLTLRGVQLSTEDLRQWTDYLHSTAHAARPSAPPFWLADHLAQLRPHWPAHSGLVGYHPLTAGLFLSELVRRADPHHRSVSRLWLEEIARPHGLEFYVGLPEEVDDSRLAKLSREEREDGAPAEDFEGSEATRLCESMPSIAITREFVAPPGSEEVMAALPEIINGAFTVVKRFSPWATRHCELPSGIGFGHARALSAAFSLLLDPHGPLVRPTVRDQALQPAVEGFDLTLFSYRSYSRAGFFLSAHYPRAFYHMGSGGAMVWGDASHGLSLAYTPSHLLAPSSSAHPSRAERLVRAVYYCLSGTSATSHL